MNNKQNKAEQQIAAKKMKPSKISSDIKKYNYIQNLLQVNEYKDLYTSHLIHVPEEKTVGMKNYILSLCRSSMWYNTAHYEWFEEEVNLIFPLFEQYFTTDVNISNCNVKWRMILKCIQAWYGCSSPRTTGAMCTFYERYTIDISTLKLKDQFDSGYLNYIQAEEQKILNACEEKKEEQRQEELCPNLEHYMDVNDMDESAFVIGIGIDRFSRDDQNNSPASDPNHKSMSPSPPSEVILHFNRDRPKHGPELKDLSTIPLPLHRQIAYHDYDTDIHTPTSPVANLNDTTYILNLVSEMNEQQPELCHSRNLREYGSIFDLQQAPALELGSEQKTADTNHSDYNSSVEGNGTPKSPSLIPCSLMFPEHEEKNKKEEEEAENQLGTEQIKKMKCKVSPRWLSYLEKKDDTLFEVLSQEMDNCFQSKMKLHLKNDLHDSNVLRLRGGAGSEQILAEVGMRNQTNRLRLMDDDEVLDNVVLGHLIGPFMNRALHQTIVVRAWRAFAARIGVPIHVHETMQHYHNRLTAIRNNWATVQLYNGQATGTLPDFINLTDFTMARMFQVTVQYWTTIGPFVMDVVISLPSNSPMDLDIISDQTRDAMIKTSSAEVINMTIRILGSGPDEEIGDFNIIDVKELFPNRNYQHILLQSHADRSRLLDELNIDQFQNHDGNCVIDYIYQQMQKTDENAARKVFQKVTPFSLVKEFEQVKGCDPKDGITVAQILDWANSRMDVSVYCINPVYLNVYSKHCSDRKWKVTLTFITAHGHLYPIGDPELRKKIIKYNKINYADLKPVSFCFETENVRCLEDEKEIQAYINGTITDDDVDCVVTSLDLEVILKEIVAQGITKTSYLTDNEETKMQQCVSSMEVNEHMLIDQIQYDNRGKVCGFVHPTTQLPIRNSEDFYQRKRICNYLFEEYKCGDFIFVDQKWQGIAAALQIQTCGKLEYSNDKYWDDVMFKFQPTPILQQVIVCESEPANALCIDHNLCYTHALRDNVDLFGIYNDFDSILKFSGIDDHSEYLVNSFKLELGLVIAKQWWSCSSVKYLLEHMHIDISCISYQRTFRKSHHAGVFMPLLNKIDALQNEFPDIKKLLKKLMNPLIGLFNKREGITQTGYMTHNDLEAIALFTQAVDYGDKVTMKELFQIGEPTFILKFEKTYPFYDNYSSVWRTVVSNANISLIRKLDQLKFSNPLMVLYGVKVDCICAAQVPYIDSDERWKVVEWNYPRFSSKVAENREELEISLRDWEDCKLETILETPTSCLVEGCAGSGKTTALINMIKNINQEQKWNTKILCTSFTHTALVVIRNRLIKEGLKPELDNGTIQCRTLDSIIVSFQNATILNKTDIESIRFTHVFCDEVSMVNTKCMIRLKEIKNYFGLELIFFGDFNQCPPVESVHYRYKEHYIFKELCNFKKIKLDYIENCGRYDMKTYDYLAYFIQHRQIHPYLKNRHLERGLPVNIVYHNMLRKQINANFRGYDYKVGQEVIGDCIGMEDTQLKRKEFYQSSIYKIKAVDMVARKVTVETYDHENSDACQMIDLDIPMSKIQPTYAVTVYKYQGKTIKEPYNIHECESMCFEEMYTALSRTTRSCYWNFEYTDKVFEYKVLNQVDQPPRNVQDRRVYLLDGEITVLFNGETIENWKKRHKINEVTEEIDLGMSRSTNNYQMTKYVKHLEGEKHNLMHGSCNYLTHEVLKLKYPIKVNEEKHQMSIRQFINGKEHNVFKKYDSMSRARIKKEMEEIQQDIINHYYLDITKDPKQLQITHYKVVLDDIEKVDVVENLAIELESYMELYDECIIADTTRYGSGVDEIKVNWYWKQYDAELQAKRQNCMLIKTVKPHPTQKDTHRHLFAAVTLQIFSIIVGVDILEKKDCYYYEILAGNARLYLDLDLDLKEMKEGTTDPAEILAYTMQVMMDAGEALGCELYDSDFRFLNASTSDKISFHITNVAHVFYRCEDQKRYWAKVEELTLQVDELWYIKHGENSRTCMLDMRVYTKNRSMRTIGSKKPFKQNVLVPCIFPGQDYIHNLELNPAKVEDYLISVNHNGLFSRLSGKMTGKKLTQEKKNYSIRKNINREPDGELKELVMTAYEHGKLPDGFDGDHLEGLGKGKGRLIRKSSGYCNGCKRIHTRENMFVEMKQKNVFISCCKGGVWKQQL